MSPDIKAIMQALFDKGLAHIRKQGYPCLRGKHCRYRGEAGAGSACIVGSLIPNARYDGELDRVGYRASSPRVLECIPELDRLPYPTRHEVGAFLGALQRECHDVPSLALSTSAFMQRVEGGAQSVATAFGLTYTPPAAGAGT